ncbi:MAG: NADPH-dependent F420 reductase [Woeseia sp.]
MRKPGSREFARAAGIALIISYALVASGTKVLAEEIAVIGTGMVSGALGPRFAEIGHDVVYGSRNPARDGVKKLVARTGHGATVTTPAEAAAGADIVVLAVPGEVVAAVTKGLGDLTGKIIIDPTNALTRGEDGLFEMAVATSNAELIQGLAPDAYVVKAFNTLNWQQMVDPESAGGPISIPLVGDNVEAKAAVATLVEGLGLEPIDVGPLRYAHVVEGMLILYLNNRFVRGQPFDFHLRKVKTK